MAFGIYGGIFEIVMIPHNTPKLIDVVEHRGPVSCTIVKWFRWRFVALDCTGILDRRTLWSGKLSDQFLWMFMPGVGFWPILTIIAAVPVEPCICASKMKPSLFERKKVGDHISTFVVDTQCKRVAPDSRDSTRLNRIHYFGGGDCDGWIIIQADFTIIIYSPRHNIMVALLITPRAWPISIRAFHLARPYEYPVWNYKRCVDNLAKRSKIELTLYLLSDFHPPGTKWRKAYPPPSESQTP